MKLERANRIRAGLGLPPLGATEPVSLTQKALKAAEAVTRIGAAFVRRDAVLVSKEEQTRRLSICKECPFYTGTTCLKCGCIARFKAKLATEACPVGKW